MCPKVSKFHQSCQMFNVGKVWYFYRKDCQFSMKYWIWSNARVRKSFGSPQVLQQPNYGGGLRISPRTVRASRAGSTSTTNWTLTATLAFFFRERTRGEQPKADLVARSAARYSASRLCRRIRVSPRFRNVRKIRDASSRVDSLADLSVRRRPRFRLDAIVSTRELRLCEWSFRARREGHHWNTSFSSDNRHVELVYSEKAP